MKKLIIAAALAASALSAQAYDITVRGGHSFGPDQNSAGVALGTQVFGVGVQAGFDRTTSGELFNRYSLVAGYDVYKLWGATLTAKAGVAYLDRNELSDGGAALVGVGVSYPVAKGFSAVADYQYQKGQTRVSDLNGNLVTVGVKFNF